MKLFRGNTNLRRAGLALLCIGFASPLLVLASSVSNSRLEPSVPKADRNIILYARLPVEASSSATRAHADPAPVFPAGVIRFDMDCEINGRVIGDPYPEGYRMSPMPSPDPWRDRFRQSLDLNRMEMCGDWCESWPPTPLLTQDAERITFHHRDGRTSWLRRSDGYYYDLENSLGRVTEETGYCRRAPFTEFPAVDDAGHGTTNGTGEGFPPNVRRFDLSCEMLVERIDIPTSEQAQRSPAPGRNHMTVVLRQSVDLDRMQYCEARCRTPQPIAGAGPGLIRFADEPSNRRWLRIGDRTLLFQTVIDGHLESGGGRCKRMPFTPFAETADDEQAARPVGAAAPASED